MLQKSPLFCYFIINPPQNERNFTHLKPTTSRDYQPQNKHHLLPQSMNIFYRGTTKYNSKTQVKNHIYHTTPATINHQTNATIHFSKSTARKPNTTTMHNHFYTIFYALFLASTKTALPPTNKPRPRPRPHLLTHLHDNRIQTMPNFHHHPHFQTQPHSRTQTERNHSLFKINRHANRTC